MYGQYNLRASKKFTAQILYLLFPTYMVDAQSIVVSYIGHPNNTKVITYLVV